MAPKPARRGKTWDDLDRVPEGFVGEIVAGEIVVHPRPDPPHIGAASHLGTFLEAAFEFGMGGPGGWVILDEPRVRFGQDIRVPDLAGWRAERFAAPERGPFAVVPSWICEVLSRSTEREDRTEKMPLYARSGVGHAWLMNPLTQTLEVYRLVRRAWTLVATFGGNAKVRAEPFAAVELDLGRVWLVVGPRKPRRRSRR